MLSAVESIAADYGLKVIYPANALEIAAISINPCVFNHLFAIETNRDVCFNVTPQAIITSIRSGGVLIESLAKVSLERMASMVTNKAVLEALDASKNTDIGTYLRDILSIPPATGYNRARTN